MPKASIVLATYCPDEARRVLCEQSFQEIHRTGVPREEYELIVVNNGGIHADLIEGLNANIIITNSHNVGQAAALNEGIAIARSINLAIMDDDLSYKEGWLQVGLKMLNKYPKYVISLREYGNKYVTQTMKSGHKFARNAGGVWIMRRRLYWLVGRFAMGYYDYGGLWTRNLIRSGSRFVVSKTPFISHIGKNYSIIGNKKGLIRRYFDPE